MKNKRMAAVAVAVACTAAMGCAAHAGGLYVGGQYGATSLLNSAQDYATEQRNQFGGTASVTQDAAPDYARLYAGYRFNEVLALELGYAQSGKARLSASGSDRDGDPYTGTRTSRFGGLDLSALIHPMPPQRELFLRVGVTAYTTTAEEASQSRLLDEQNSTNSSGLGTLLGIGYDLKLGSGALRFEMGKLQDISNIGGNDATTYSVGYHYGF